jgi:hypothetical protein
MGFLGEGGSDCSSGAILTCHWKLAKDWRCDLWKVFAQKMLKLHKCNKILQLTQVSTKKIKWNCDESIAQAWWIGHGGALILVSFKNVHSILLNEKKWSYALSCINVINE